MSLTFYLRRACGLTDKDSMDLEQWCDPYIQMANEALKGKLIQYGTGKRDKLGDYENYHKFTAVGLIIESADSYTFEGTSKPTRYHVIHDDSDFKMGDIMRLPYYLCYGFVRCTQPVSYPAATYYAHLATYRARNLLEREGENADLEALQRQLTIHQDLKNYPMFFVKPVFCK